MCNKQFLLIMLYLCDIDKLYIYRLGNSRKNPNREGWGYGISRGIKKIASGISSG